MRTIKKDFNDLNKRKPKKKVAQQGENLASEVTISYDPRIVEEHRKKKASRTAEEIRLDKEYEQQLERQSKGIGGGRLASMGLDSSMGKDQRKFQLQSLINKKEVVTLQSAMKAMALSKSTLASYLREMGYQMWDAKESKFVGDKDGIRVGLDDVE